MGSGSSTDTTQAKALGKKDNEIVGLMMPIYYTAEEMLPEQRKLASDSWNLILNDTIPDVDERKKNDPEFTSVTFFYDSFYARLFDIHPMSRELFKDVKAQGKFLVSMITLSLSELDNPEKFNTALVKLAEVHYHRGVKASEYGIVGEVLFWALRQVVGTEFYTDKMHSAWVKVYSRMLRVIVPVAISWELERGSSKVQSTRVSNSRSRAVDSAQLPAQKLML